MHKRKKGVTLEPSLIDELEIVAKQEQLSFSQLLENAADYLERRKQLEPESLKDTIREIVVDELKKQQEIPVGMRNYMRGY